MGAYATCWVGNLVVVSSRNGIDPGVMNLFRSTDKIVRHSTDQKLPKHVADQWSDDEEGLDITYYEADISVVRDRLELEGYTLANARRLFEEWRVLEIKRQESSPLLDMAKHPEIAAAASKELQQLRDLSVDKWMAYLRRIDDEELTYKNQDEHKESFLGNMLNSSGTESWYGYSGPDPLVGVRLAIEAYPEATTFTYDVTDLLLEGYLDLDEDPIERVIDETTNQYHTLGRIVVLTEGRSDAWILQEAMAVLYPHLTGYFSFMEFEEFRVGGGAGQLANLVKAFAGAGIVNRVIAVFDNDAAAAAALTTLRKIKIPRHIVTMQLPPLDVLRAYPTLGPAGLSVMDINGMAGSVELYLGSDVLKINGEAFSPIQWTGYEPTVQLYQGELLSKIEIQERFRLKLAKAKVDANYCAECDWSGLRRVLVSIFEAFHSLDGESLLQQMRFYYRDDVTAICT